MKRRPVHGLGSLNPKRARASPPSQPESDSLLPVNLALRAFQSGFNVQRGSVRGQEAGLAPAVLVGTSPYLPKHPTIRS
jgi:hypothetical protein